MRRPAKLLLGAFLTACAAPPPIDPRALEASLPRPAPGERPLVELIDQGYTAAYVPIALDGGKVVTAGPGGGRELEPIDFGPLAQRLRGQRSSFLLVLGMTGEPAELYAALLPVLRRHRDVLVRYESGEVLAGRLRVVLAGSVPLDEMAAERTRYSFAAGGLGVLEERYSPALVPLVRVRYEDLLEWRGDGALPEAQRLRLQAVAARTPAQGRTLAVRGAPANEAVWEALLAGGVDHLEVGAGDSREALRFARFLGRRASAG